jgi:hypothetical protein
VSDSTSTTQPKGSAFGAAGYILILALTLTSCTASRAVAMMVAPPMTTIEHTEVSRTTAAPTADEHVASASARDRTITANVDSINTATDPVASSVVGPTAPEPPIHSATAFEPMLLDPFAPIATPDVGEHCATGLDATSLTAFFAQPIGDFAGADYQRGLRLDDGRVLWTFQDAFVSGTLVHNVGMIQSGRCFTMLNDGPRSWLLADATSHMARWHWILDGAAGADGETFHLFVVEMTETGPNYLSRTRPTALRRVVLDASTLGLIEVVDEQIDDDAQLFGWSVTSDAHYSYLYSHCYQQFGHDTGLGIADCAIDVKVARVPTGAFDAPREYWSGRRWSPDPAAATPVVDGTFVFSGNNPAQVRFDGKRFVLIEKRDDWWGLTVEVGVADSAQGPFRHVVSIDEPRKCDPSQCNTYFAAWVPWLGADGEHIWSIGHNTSRSTARHSTPSTWTQIWIAPLHVVTTRQRCTQRRHRSAPAQRELDRSSGGVNRPLLPMSTCTSCPATTPTRPHRSHFPPKRGLPALWLHPLTWSPRSRHCELICAEQTVDDSKRSDRGRLFEQVPELYDRVRPGYPSELFADLVHITGIADDASILEVGCGTGQATRPLAELGYNITAVEPGPGLARLARQRVVEFPNVGIEVSSFESWDDQQRRARRHALPRVNLGPEPSIGSASPKAEICSRHISGELWDLRLVLR